MSAPTSSTHPTIRQRVVTAPSFTPQNKIQNLQHSQTRRLWLGTWTRYTQQALLHLDITLLTFMTLPERYQYRHIVRALTASLIDPTTRDTSLTVSKEVTCHMHMLCHNMHSNTIIASLHAHPERYPYHLYVFRRSFQSK